MSWLQLLGAPRTDEVRAPVTRVVGAGSCHQSPRNRYGLCENWGLPDTRCTHRIVTPVLKDQLMLLMCEKILAGHSGNWQVASDILKWTIASGIFAHDHFQSWICLLLIPEVVMESALELILSR